MGQIQLGVSIAIASGFVALASPAADFRAGNRVEPKPTDPQPVADVRSSTLDGRAVGKWGLVIETACNVNDSRSRAFVL